MSIFGIRSRAKSLVKTVLGLDGPPSSPSDPEVRVEPTATVSPPSEASVVSDELQPQASEKKEALLTPAAREESVETQAPLSEEEPGEPEISTEDSSPVLKRAKPVELSPEDIENLNQLEPQKTEVAQEDLPPVEVQINVQETPNPDACMFQVDVSLIESGTYEFKEGDDIGHAPLAQRLLALDGVELILIAPRFVTVRKAESASWDSLNEQVMAALDAFFQSRKEAVKPTEQTFDTANLSDVEQRILDLLDEEIRPAIAMDGGDLVYHGFEEGIVKIQLTGACGTCPSSTATLYYGVQNLLMEEIPEVQGVEQISA